MPEACTKVAPWDPVRGLSYQRIARMEEGIFEGEVIRNHRLQRNNDESMTSSEVFCKIKGTF